MGAVTTALQTTDSAASRSDVGAALLAMDHLHGTSQQTLARGTILIVPKGQEVVSIKRYLDEFADKPERRQGTATITDAASFVDHIRRFGSDESVVFANPDRAKPSLTAVYDYHPASAINTEAAFLKHRAVYAPALSDAWKAWTWNDGKAMNQADFAAFIEDRVTDIIVPNLDDPALATFANLVQGRFAEPSELVALSRGLQINVDVAVKQAVVLATGEISVKYDEQHRDGEGAPINIPNLFQIAVPVFYAGDLYRIAARLRYRMTGQRLTWFYQLVRTDLVFDDAFRGLVEKVRDETEVPVFLGSPEV